MARATTRARPTRRSLPPLHLLPAGRRGRTLWWTCAAGMAAVVLMLLASLWRTVGYEAGRHRLWLETGRIHYRHVRPDAAPTARPGLRITNADRGLDLDALMIDWHLYASWWFVTVPLWIPFLLFALPGAATWIVRIRFRSEGRCVKCGYALRGLPAGAETRCPECGSARHAVR